MATSWTAKNPPGADRVSETQLRPRSGIFVNLVIQPRLNPAFPVLFLLAHDISHQGNLAGLVHHVRVMAWFAAGAAWRRFPLTHNQILLQARILAQRTARTIIPGTAKAGHACRQPDRRAGTPHQSQQKRTSVGPGHDVP
jgi:hypothetical protein